MRNKKLKEKMVEAFSNNRNFKPSTEELAQTAVSTLTDEGARFVRKEEVENGELVYRIYLFTKDGERHLVPTWGYGRETLIGGTQITQLYREADFEFGISFEIKVETDFLINTNISIDSTDNFDFVSKVTVSSETEFGIDGALKIITESIYNIESKTSKELSVSFEITSNLSHKRLIKYLNLLD